MLNLTDPTLTRISPLHDTFCDSVDLFLPITFRENPFRFFHPQSFTYSPHWSRSPKKRQPLDPFSPLAPPRRSGEDLRSSPSPQVYGEEMKLTIYAHPPHSAMVP